jgi:hypothetical protein
MIYAVWRGMRGRQSNGRKREGKREGLENWERTEVG